MTRRVNSCVISYLSATGLMMVGQATLAVKARGVYSDAIILLCSGVTLARQRVTVKALSARLREKASRFPTAPAAIDQRPHPQAHSEPCSGSGIAISIAAASAALSPAR